MEAQKKNVAARKSAVDLLNSNLERWRADEDIVNNIPQYQDEFKQLLTQLNQQFPIKTPIFSQLETAFSKLVKLAYSKNLLSYVSKIRDGAKLVEKHISAKDFEKALAVQNGLLETEETLNQISLDDSKSIPVRNTALKTLYYFNKNIRGKLQAFLDIQFREFFESAEWPVKTLQPKFYPQFVLLFEKYLSTEINPAILTLSGPLASFKILVEPIDLRFKYHFEGKAVTNRVDKPEWAFHHFLNIIDSHFGFLAGPVTEVLNKLELFADRNGVYEFITAFLPSIKSKMFSLFEEVSDSPNLLSHLVYETVLFDNALKEKYYYLPYGKKVWKGVAGELLSNANWFQKWLAVETESATERYLEIETAPNAFEIDYDAVDPSETAPTISAVNLKDLLETITDHYSSLASVRFRLRYFLAVQVNLLDKYYARLVESMEAFDSMTSGFTRAVGGVSKEDMQLVTGINGLERLCRIYGSLNYISYFLEQWGDEEFFLQLWHDITTLSGSKQTLDQTSKDAIKAVTQHAVEGTVFDETNTGYKELCNRVENSIVNLLKRELQHSMKEYFKKSDWAELTELETSESAVLEAGVSRQIAQPVKHIGTLFAFLERFFGVADYTRVRRRFTRELETYFWNYIIGANRFAAAGGAQLYRDVEALGASKRLQQAARLLALPESSSASASEGDVSASALYSAVVTADFERLEAIKQQLGIDLTLEDIRHLLDRRADLA